MCLKSDRGSIRNGDIVLRKVLLTDTSWWPLSSRLAIALTKAGCAVSAVYPADGHPLTKTSVIRQRFSYRPTDPAGSVRAAIENVEPDLIIPCDDRAVRHLHQLHASAGGGHAQGSKLKELVEKSLGSSESYAVVSSRYRLLQVAREEGIPIPETRVIAESRDLMSCQGLKLPWVLKADGTWGGHGVKIAHNPRQAQQYLADLSRPLSSVRYLKRLLVDRDPFWLETWRQQKRADVVAQSYVEGRPANSVMFCWKGEVLADTGVEVVNAQGATGPATIVRVVESPQMRFAAQRLASRLSLSGLFGLDFMIEEETGNFYLIEMNPRCTPLSHLRLGPGRDLISAIAAQVAGSPLSDTQPVTQKETIAYFPQAWHRDPKSQLLQSSYHDVPWEEPELVLDLLRIPYPERSIPARVANSFRRKSFQRRPGHDDMFKSALANRRPV